MTGPQNQRLDRINPSPTVHNRPPERPSVRRLTSKQVGVIGTVIVDLILANVALALGGINILGFKPFAFLTSWGEEIQRRAADAFNKAMAAEAVANSADANQAMALGQVAVTKDNLETTQNGLQTTWNNLWEASYNTTLPTGTNKNPTDVKAAQVVVRTNAINGASGAVVNGQNIQGTWDAVWNGTYNTNVTGKDLTAVRTATGAIVYTTNIAGSAAETAANNIQNTWNGIYVSAGGAGAGNRSLADAQDRLGLLNTTAYRADGNVYNTWDEYFRAVYGWTKVDPTAQDFGEAVKDFGTGVIEIEKKYDPLIPDEGGSTLSGNSISDTFTDYVTSLPNPPWTTTYMYPPNGYGSGTIGVNSKKLIVWTGPASFRRGQAIYNKTQLKTRYHKVSIGLVGWPQVGASNWIFARSNETVTDAIAARIYINTFLFFFNTSFTVELYSIKTSEVIINQVPRMVTSYDIVETTTTNLPTPNSTWTLQCGTDDTPSGLNTYRVLCDGKQVLSKTVFGLAGLGDPNDEEDDGGNYVGFGMEANAFLGVPFLPAPVNSFSAYDNIAADYLGCGYRASRATTTAYNLPVAAGGAVVPAAAFTSDDIPITNTLTKVSESEIKVSIEGWYLVGVNLTINSSATVRPAVFVGGNLRSLGTSNNQACSTFMVYAQPNESISPGYVNGGFSTLPLIGDGAGTTTHWSLTFIGNRLPSNPSTV